GMVVARQSLCRVYPPQRAAWRGSAGHVPPAGVLMAIKSLKILVRITFPDASVTRLHDGAGPFLDTNGDLWLGACLTEGLDEIEMAMNGEAATLMLGVSGLAHDGAGLAFEEMEAGNVIGGKVQLLLQGMDAWDQPTGSPEVKFTGTIDNMP